jgi:predicted dithiol-disulfide oxidoreductase (DUF899 family)
VEKDYRFEGPEGPVGLLDLFEGRRQLIVYRFFFEPGVAGWPESRLRSRRAPRRGIARIYDLDAPARVLIRPDGYVAYVARGDYERRLADSANLMAPSVTKAMR